MAGPNTKGLKGVKLMPNPFAGLNAFHRICEDVFRDALKENPGSFIVTEEAFDNERTKKYVSNGRQRVSSIVVYTRTDEGWSIEVTN